MSCWPTSPAAGVPPDRGALAANAFPEAAGARRWLAPMGVLLLSSLLCPSKTYGYVRYAPALPLVGLFACLALWEGGFRLGRRAACLLFPVWALCVALPWAMKAPENLSRWFVALDFRTLLAAAPQEVQGLRIVSDQAFLDTDETRRLYRRNRHVYPERADVYSLGVLFAENGLAIQENPGIDREQALEDYVSPINAYLLIPKSCPLRQRLTPCPLAVDGLLPLPARAWQDFRRRWLPSAAQAGNAP